MGKLTKAQSAFNDWWSAEGQYLDPDTSDVPWFDKRRVLAEAAFLAGGTLPEEKMRCTICGFVVDTRFEATKPTIQFKMAGRGAALAQATPETKPTGGSNE